MNTHHEPEHAHGATGRVAQPQGPGSVGKNGWTRRATVTLLCVATLLMAPGVVPAAQASIWNWGLGFNIGGLHFRIGHQSHGHRYFRTSHHIRSRARCTDRCYARNNYNYHHESCPVIRGHFHRHGSSVSVLLSEHGPRIRGDRYDRYNRYDRYDRGYRDRRSRDRRYRDRSRDHRHRDGWRYERDRYNGDRYACPYDG